MEMKKSILKRVLVNRGRYYINVEEMIEDLGLNPKAVDYKEIL